MDDTPTATSAVADDSTEDATEESRTRRAGDRDLARMLANPRRVRRD